MIRICKSQLRLKKELLLTKYIFQLKALSLKRIGRLIIPEQKSLRNSAQKMSNSTSEAEGSDGYKCAGCDRPDTADDIVQCDKCTAWWHFSCAKVDASVANRTNWICVKCLSPPPPPRSVSIRTTSSNRRALLDISLQRLAEEKELRKKELAIEKEFMKAKYDLMEQCALDEEAETRSVRSRIEQIESRALA